MTNEEPDEHSRSFTMQKTRFSLAALMVVLTVFAILLAWLADHCRLVKQIPAQPQKLLKVYQLSFASAELATQQLSELFPSYGFACDLNSNDVIVNASKIDHDRIQMIIQYIDRKDTEFIETETSELDKDTLTTESD